MLLNNCLIHNVCATGRKPSLFMDAEVSFFYQDAKQHHGMSIPWIFLFLSQRPLQAWARGTCSTWLVMLYSVSVH